MNANKFQYADPCRPREEYGLLSIRWGGEPLMFEDLDEGRDELNSRPVEK
jgi:hypothetical protein